MPDLKRPRYTTPRLGQRDFKVSLSAPRWFVRRAVPRLGLSTYAVTTWLIIADNLDMTGISTTAIALIAERGNMSRNAAAKAIDQLIAEQCLFELDPRKNGHVMRYAIPADEPWTGAP